MISSSDFSSWHGRQTLPISLLITPGEELYYLRKIFFLPQSIRRIDTQHSTIMQYLSLGWVNFNVRPQ